ncbi:IS110 family transposase [Streptomyces luteolifulvus]|uniref:IS110 family transposase n=1 Tax=Streptomyces luteolifulvus TaxID=2615112 RepID=A0A643JWX4_9ACTN|nr:IS110 family transposase [Streptomyces luteolifulvus]KAB1138808.1 IS110 family transposase [Streptomyces luteolifulvus]
MQVIFERCAGLDVHRDTAVATVRSPGQRRGSRATETRTFKTTVRALADLGDWLVCEGVELVGMEATGVYWKPVFAALEGRFTCWLVNAAHLRNVPGRKTDVADSVWIARILECGLVRPSFVPVQEFRELRDLTRARTAVSQERVRVIQRLEKVLQDAGIKLTSVASQVWSKTARAVLEALLDGVTSPVELAALAKGRLRSKREALEEALEHRFRIEHHGVIVRGLLAHIDGLEQRLDAYDAEIAIRLAPHQEVLELIQTIPGVGAKVAQVLIAEIGLDMSGFPSSAHLASWAGVCPGNHASGGKRRGGRSRPGPKWLKAALTEAAWGAVKAKGTYLHAHHMQIKGRAGGFKALGATRHDIVVAYWHIVHDQVPYRELGPDWAARRFSPEQRARRLTAQLEALGFDVTIGPAGTGPA